MRKDSKIVAMIATGNELLRGEFINSTTYDISKILAANQIDVLFHMTVSDGKIDIVNAVNYAIFRCGAIIVTGGLGPTSDDNTKEAIAEALGMEMIFYQEIWEYIKTRLQKFSINITESNRKQAFFPKACSIISNPNGTACGGHVKYNNVDIFFLPGPPNECLPMFNDYVLPYLKINDYCGVYKTKKWRMIGVIESEFAEKIEQIFAGNGVEISYTIPYPYLILSIRYNNDISDLIGRVESDFANYILNADDIASDIIKGMIDRDEIKISIMNNTPVAGLFNIFENSENPTYHITVFGLNEIESRSEFGGRTEVFVRINDKEYSTSFPYRDEEVGKYAIEYTCFVLLKFLAS